MKGKFLVVCKSGLAGLSINTSKNPKHSSEVGWLTQCKQEQSIIANRSIHVSSMPSSWKGAIMH